MPEDKTFSPQKVRELAPDSAEFRLASDLISDQIVEFTERTGWSEISGAAMLMDAIVYGMAEIDPDATVDFLMGTLAGLNAETAEDATAAQHIRVEAMKRATLALQSMVANAAGQVN